MLSHLLQNDSTSTNVQEKFDVFKAIFKQDPTDPEAERLSVLQSGVCLQLGDRRKCPGREERHDACEETFRGNFL